jgi:hypothetical protein
VSVAEAVQPDEDDLSSVERIRLCAHRDVERVCSAWEPALRDAEARGFGSGRSFDGCPGGQSELTSVEAAASRPDFATAWLAELGDVLHDMGIPARRDRFHGWTAETCGPWMHRRVDKMCQTFNREANRTLLRLHRLAAAAHAYWPPPLHKGQRVGNVVVGERGNTVETCALCGEPAPSGRDPETGITLIKTLDGQVFHNTNPACYYVVYRQRKAAKEAVQ